MEEEDDILFYQTNISLDDYIHVLNKYTQEFNENHKEEYITNMKTKRIPEEYEYMELPISFIENRWKCSPYYITSNMENIKQKEKYIYSRRDLIRSQIYDPPILEIINQYEFDFINGRNRFANMRDLGYTKTPVWIKKNDTWLLHLMQAD